MQIKPVSLRSIALLTGLALASTAFGTAPAHALEKSKKLKYGAIAAGVAGAYFLSKGKVAPAAVLGGAGYYAYKKGQDAREEERFGSNRDRYGYNRGNFGNRNGGSRDYDSRGRDNDFRNSGDVYPEDYSTDYRGNAAVRPGRQGRGNYDLRPYQR